GQIQWPGEPAQRPRHQHQGDRIGPARRRVAHDRAARRLGQGRDPGRRQWLDIAQAAVGILSDAARAEISRRCAEFVRATVAWPGEVEPRHAAVAIAITDAEDGSPAFVLTRRVSRLRAHAGQWALPGGRLDAGETAIDAVLRELDEEVGLARGTGDVLAVL